MVLNSGFTFREQQYLNNAWQVARLPDWALVDLDTPPDENWPGRVLDAGFFDEHWRNEVAEVRWGVNDTLLAVSRMLKTAACLSYAPPC